MGSYPAPALEKGVRVLNELIGKGPVNLETLARKTEIPKASLLRILNTLGSLDMVERSNATKEYTSLVRIVPFSSHRNQARLKIQKALHSLSVFTGKTTEWYVFDSVRLVITDRVEPEQPVVQVRARIGFMRELNGEFDAVARSGLAYLEDHIQTGSYWTYRKGEKMIVDDASVLKRLKQVKRKKAVMDREYNTNGVRRYAAPVLNPEDNTLFGIMAIAENYTPDADTHRNIYLTRLKETAVDLHNEIKKVFSSIP